MHSQYPLHLIGFHQKVTVVVRVNVVVYSENGGPFKNCLHNSKMASEKMHPGRWPAIRDGPSIATLNL